MQHVGCLLFSLCSRRAEKNPINLKFATCMLEITQENASILFLDVQTRRAEHRYELAEGQHLPTPRPGASGAHGPPSRLEWVCHQSGTDRVYINHREHYV